MTSQLLPLVSSDSVQAIVTTAPQAYQINVTSHDKCLAAGEALLMRAAEEGMNAVLDSAISSYLEKTKKTQKAMNDRRSSVTKLFDEIRSAYTSVENNINPTKQGTVPYQLQTLRNQYAAQLRAEEEKRRTAALLQVQRSQALQALHSDTETALQKELRETCNRATDHLHKIFNDATIENIDTLEQTLRAQAEQVAPTFGETLTPSFSPHLDTQTAKNEQDKIIRSQQAKLQEVYLSRLQAEVKTLCEMLPSKRKMLEEMSRADEAQKAAMQAQMQQAEAEMQARAAAERAAAEQQAAAAEKAKRAAEDAKALFAGAATLQTETAPKVAVKQRIRLLSPEGISAVLALWFEQEGCKMSTEELEKTFKKQITFCERLANKEGILIHVQSVVYEEEVKAK